MLDNASIHHDLQFKALLKAAVKDPSCGLIDFLFLPPYSPDYNPIERCFSQIKQWLRRFQTLAVADVKKAIALACRIVTPENARNYWHAAGTSPTTTKELCCHSSQSMGSEREKRLERHSHAPCPESI